MREAKRYTPDEIHKRAPWLFKPGNTIRPHNTRPPKQITALAREYTECAVLTLVHIMTRSRATDGEKRACAEELLNRGWGKSPQSIALFGDGNSFGAGATSDMAKTLSMETKVEILMAVSERGTDALMEFQDALPAPVPASEDTIDLLDGEPTAADLVG